MFTNNTTSLTCQKKASEKEKTLYWFLGKSLCAVQILEDALSHLIVLKKTEPHEREEADNLLKKQWFYTYGSAISIALIKFAETLEVKVNDLLYSEE